MRWAVIRHLAEMALKRAGARRLANGGWELTSFGRSPETKTLRSIKNAGEAGTELSGTIQGILNEYTEHPLRDIAACFTEEMRASFPTWEITSDEDRATAAVAFAVFNANYKPTAMSASTGA